VCAQAPKYATNPCVPSPPVVCCNAQMTDAATDKEAIEQV
jgi:hypothetical protein